MTTFANSISRKGVSLSWDGYVRLAEAAERLKVSVRTLYRWIDKGHLPGATKMNPFEDSNSPYMIPIEDIERIEDLRKNPNARGKGA